MRDIKRITIDYKGLPFFDEDGVYVSYEDCAKIIEDLNNKENDEIDANCQIAELKQQLNAMAAENSALIEVYRQAVKELDDTCFEIGMMRGEKSMEYPAPETPATDAYLNSVRAEGVEMLLASLPPHYTARADIEQFYFRLAPVRVVSDAKFR